MRAPPAGSGRCLQQDVPAPGPADRGIVPEVLPGHRDIHFQGGYCRYEPMVPAVSWLMRQAPTAWGQTAWGHQSTRRYVRTYRLLGTGPSRFNPRADGWPG